MNTLKNEIGKRLLFFDGAMGSMLQKMGLKTGELPERLNITNPEMIRGIHKMYLEAGADIISANTFGAFCTKYDNVEEIIEKGIENARLAIEETGLKNKYIALDLGSCGKLLKPIGELEFEDCCDIFKRSIAAGTRAGADIILLETLSDTYEAKAAVLAAKESSDLPIIVSMTFDEKGKALTGADVVAASALAEGLGADVFGINCGLGPKQIKPLFEKLYDYCSIPILLQPNAGLPRVENGVTVYDVMPDEFSDYAREFAQKGAWLLGGCCGTTPEHIRAVCGKCRNIDVPPVSEKNITVISSYSRAVVIDKKPLIIGERINPTGKKKFKEALKNNDIGYILNEAVSQEENGADILDVNVGLPEIDEAEMMVNAVKKIQSATDLPLQIDSSTPEVIEKALRIYNGKPLVNSVNGKKEIMEAVFPAVKKYGGVILGLALDEDGIPPKAEDRLKIAERIVNTAQRYGIKKKDIAIDTLTLTVSAQQEEAIETVKALKLVKDKLGVKTCLGVSNISFGLPERQLINTNFLTMAIYNGLNLCIMNPMSKPMKDAINACNVLLNYDKGCLDYINEYSSAQKTEQKADVKTEKDLKDLVVSGLKESSYDAAKKLLESTEPLSVINDYIVPALDIVGQGYEKGTIFLPQLIMSAETAKNAFNAIREHMEQTGTQEEKKGTVVIATVQGDIHDIGKNIVKALLENYGFEVIDLGKDVPVETVVNTVVEKDIKLVALSALMTTTVVNMEKTIAQIRKVKPECRIMVGGAVLNEDYAMQIGADFYGKDALADVYYAQKIFGE